MIISMSSTQPRVILSAKVIRACANCGSSGYNPKNNKYYEDFCPDCGMSRPKIEDKGVIYDNSFLWQLKKKIKGWFNN